LKLLLFQLLQHLYGIHNTTSTTTTPIPPSPYSPEMLTLPTHSFVITTSITATSKTSPGRTICDFFISMAHLLTVPFN